MASLELRLQEAQTHQLPHDQFLASSVEKGPENLFSRLLRQEADQAIRTLVTEFRRAVGRPEAPVLIDQEGGRVQRIGPPGWRKYPGRG